MTDFDEPKPATPVQSRLRQLLRLGPSKSDYETEAHVWFRRKKAAEKSRNAVQEELQQMRGRAHTAEMQRDQARRDLTKYRADAEEKLDRMRRQVEDFLYEPAPAPGGVCTKIRFHHFDEANDFLHQLAHSVGQDPQHYEVYDCKDCPRSPVTMKRYRHVGHPGGNEAAQAAKTQAKEQRSREVNGARREGRLLEQMVDPRVLARLRAAVATAAQPPKADGARS